MSLGWYATLGMRCQHSPTPYPRQSLWIWSHITKLVFSKKPRVSPCTKACKDPTLAPTISQLSVHDSSKAALQRRMPGTAVFMCFSEAMLRGTFGIYLSGSVSPAHTNSVPIQGTAVSPFLLSLHESLVFPECRNLQPHPGPWLPSKHEVLAFPCQLSMLNAKKNPKSLYWTPVPMNL